MSDNCKHPKITAFSFEDTGEPAGLWACAYCGHKFVPIDLEMERDAERYSALRRGQHWSVIDGIGNDIIAEREACAKVVESFIDPEIESNTAYEDQVVDGMLWQVIA